MSVLIKGIEMPKNHNHVTITIWSNGTASYGLHDRGESLVDFRSVEVVPVPPHGRLGDLDELHKEAIRRSEKAGTYDSWYNCTDRVISAFDIEAAPTIIPADELV